MAEEFFLTHFFFVFIRGLSGLLIPSSGELALSLPFAKVSLPNLSDVPKIPRVDEFDGIPCMVGFLERSIEFVLR